MSDLIERPTDAMQLVARAIEADIDAEQLGKLLDLQRDHEADQARKAYFRAMRETQRELPVVVRDAQNSHTRSKYSRLETISRAIDPVIHANGFSISYGTEDSTIEDCIRIAANVMHDDGHSTHHHLDLPLDGGWLGWQDEQNRCTGDRLDRELRASLSQVHDLRCRDCG